MAVQVRQPADHAAHWDHSQIPASASHQDGQEAVESAFQVSTHHDKQKRI